VYSKLKRHLRSEIHNMSDAQIDEVLSTTSYRRGVNRNETADRTKGATCGHFVLDETAHVRRYHHRDETKVAKVTEEGPSTMLKD